MVENLWKVASVQSSGAFGQEVSQITVDLFVALSLVFSYNIIWCISCHRKSKGSQELVCIAARVFINMDNVFSFLTLFSIPLNWSKPNSPFWPTRLIRNYWWFLSFLKRYYLLKTKDEMLLSKSTFGRCVVCSLLELHISDQIQSNLINSIGIKSISLTFCSRWNNTWT